MIKFVVITTQRSGSTLLVRSLDQNKNVLLSGEIFYFGSGIHHPENQFHFTYFPILPKRYQYWLNAPGVAFNYKSHIRNYFKKAEKEVYKAAGFKLMISQMKLLPNFLRFLKNENIKTIVLIRKNTADIVFSSIIAKQTGQYHSIESRPGMNDNKEVFIKPERFIKHFRKSEKTKTILNKIATRSSAPTIYYEDFIKWNALIKQVCDFIEIDYYKVEQSLKKINRDNHYKTIISNYNSLINIIDQPGYNRT